MAAATCTRPAVTPANLGSTAIRCHAYTFRHQIGDEKPADVPCTGQVVALARPVAEPDFNPAAVATLTGVLRRLVAAHTTDATTVTRHVGAAFGPPVTVTAEPA